MRTLPKKLRLRLRLTGQQQHFGLALLLGGEAIVNNPADTGSASHHRDLVLNWGYVGGNRGRVEDEGGYNEPHKYHVKFVESGEHLAIAFQSPEQSLHFIAFLVYIFIVFPWIETDLLRRD